MTGIDEHGVQGWQLAQLAHQAPLSLSCMPVPHLACLSVGAQIVWARPRDHHTAGREGASRLQWCQLPALHHRGAHPQLAPLLGGAHRPKARQYAPWPAVQSSHGGSHLLPSGRSAIGCQTRLKHNTAQFVGRAAVITPPMCSLTPKELHRQKGISYKQRCVQSERCCFGHGSMLLRLQLCRAMLAVLSGEQ